MREEIAGFIQARQQDQTPVSTGFSQLLELILVNAPPTVVAVADLRIQDAVRRRA